MVFYFRVVCVLPFAEPVAEKVPTIDQNRVAGLSPTPSFEAKLDHEQELQPQASFSDVGTFEDDASQMSGTDPGTRTKPEIVRLASTVLSTDTESMALDEKKVATMEAKKDERSAKSTEVQEALDKFLNEDTDLTGSKTDSSLYDELLDEEREYSKGMSGYEAGQATERLISQAKQKAILSLKAKDLMQKMIYNREDSLVGAMKVNCFSIFDFSSSSSSCARSTGSTRSRGG